MRGPAMVSGLDMLMSEKKDLEDRLARVNASIAKKTVSKKPASKDGKGEAEIVEGVEARRARMENIMNVNDKTMIRGLKKFLQGKGLGGKPEKSVNTASLAKELE